jgi:hypothetical protein
MSVMLLDSLTVIVTALLLLMAAGCLAEWVMHR